MSNGIPIRLFTSILSSLAKYQSCKEGEKLNISIEYVEETDTHTEVLHLVSKRDHNSELVWMLTPGEF